jgi:hypothetical protein
MKLRGLLVASAALGLMSAGAGIATAADSEGGGVKCAGINSCAGKGECSAADGSHDCGGHNTCKGKGWVKVASAEDCKKQGGTVVEEDAD